MRNFLLAAAIGLVASLAPSASAQTSVVYGGITGATPTFTGSTPRTYMGQAFNVSDPGVAVAITQLRITLVAGVTLNYADSQLRIQFWDTFNPAATGTTLAFSNPVGGLQIFDTGAINTTGATAFTFTINFASPILLTGLNNHGIVVNWQADAAGTGNFVDDTNLTAALRTGAGATAPPALTAGSNANVGGTTYFRNASGLTTMNLQAGDARNIANVSGLMFELTAVSIPEPSTFVLLGAAGLAVLFRARRR